MKLNKLHQSFVALAFLVIPIQQIYALAMPPAIGSIQKHHSQNGKFVLEVKISADPGRSRRSPFEIQLKKGGAVQWKQIVTGFPTEAAVSNNGKWVVLVVSRNSNWDEGAADVLIFLDDRGQVLKDFAHTTMWDDDRIGISPDGQFYVTTHTGDDYLQVDLFNVPKGERVWHRIHEREGADWLQYLRNVEISPNSAFILLLSSDNEAKSMLTLWDLSGGLLSSKRLPDVENQYRAESMRARFLNDTEFEVFAPDDQYESFRIKNNRIEKRN